MNKILAILHVALISTVLYPVFSGVFVEARPNFLIPVPWRVQRYLHSGPMLPLEEVLLALNRRNWLPSVALAGLPAFLALLNLPLILKLKGETGERWRAFSSLILGFLSTAMMFQLILRYGYGREWGGIVIWFDSLLLLIAGTAAAARLRPVVDAPPDTRNPVTP